MGCACITTGFIFFVEKRKKQHAKAGGQGSRIVDALAVSTVTGMLIATLGILIANRLLPEALPAGWPPRGDLEEYLFWAAWALAMLHAFVRSAPVAQGRINPAWRDQCCAVAAMAVAAVLLNWVTTGDHLLKTIGRGYWPVAGVDLFMLTAALLACTAGMGWLALAMESHWAQVHEGMATSAQVLRLRVLGALGLAAGLALCLAVDHASMAVLVWVMALGFGALAMAFTLTWRPKWMRVVAWVVK